MNTGEVTLAARATRVHGLDIRQGQPIGIVDGDLVVAAGTLADAVRAGGVRMAGGHDGVCFGPNWANDANPRETNQKVKRGRVSRQEHEDQKKKEEAAAAGNDVGERPRDAGDAAPCA